MVQTHSLGRAGEDLISDLLQVRGWQLLARNWRRRSAELDLVMCRGEQILFVEVKTRRCTRAADDLAQLLSWRKQQILLRSVQAFLKVEQPTSYTTYRLYLAVVIAKACNAPLITWFPLEIDGERASELSQANFHNEKTPPSSAGYFSRSR